MKRISIVIAACLALLAGGLVVWRQLRPHPKGIVFLMLDTTRADHVGVYGYPRQTTPVIDELAGGSTRYTYAITAAPWTPPSVATMFTGLYPATHGWMPPNNRELVRESSTKLADELVTLAEVLKGAGYNTAAASPNPWITEEFGYHQGFDTFWYKPRVKADEIVKAGRKFIDTFLESDRPFFLYLHFLDPHDPYSPPGSMKTIFSDAAPVSGAAPRREYTKEVSDKINLYDGEIRFLDGELGKLFAYMKEKGIYDDLSIVLVADHGEQFMERGNQGHGYQLFNEEVHVPLIIKSPGQHEAKTVDVTVSTVDLYPTVLALAGVLPPQAVPGLSLLDEQALAERRGVFSEIQRKVHQKAFTTSGGMKLITEVDGEKGEHIIGVFDGKRDPNEITPVKDDELVMSLNGDLQSVYQYALEGRLQSETGRGQLKESTVEQLKTLGYLQ